MVVRNEALLDHHDESNTLIGQPDLFAIPAGKGIRERRGIQKILIYCGEQQILRGAANMLYIPYCSPSTKPGNKEI
jgi:hypothetical protein